MKRPILLALGIVVAVFCYCYWGLAPKDARPAMRPQPASAAVEAPVASRVRTAIASAPSVAQASAPIALTEERRRILDSPDLMAAVAKIRKGGTQDEKDWALLIRAACLQVRAASRAAEASSSVRAASNLAGDDAPIAAERKQALEVLLPRCKGILQLSPEDSASLQSDLIAGSAKNPSVLGRLHAIVLSQDNRWNEDQEKLITDALYSDDPILVREAFYATQGAMDMDAPGGADRRRAFELAFPADVITGQQSDFERLSACYVIKLCASNANAFADQGKTNANVDRLVDQYKAALASHMSAIQILAIR